jgi:hypothetical protein
MFKILVSIAHENGGTITDVKMDGVPRVGDYVNIFKGSTTSIVSFVVRKVSWTVVGKNTSSVLIVVADSPPSENPERVESARGKRRFGSLWDLINE